MSTLHDQINVSNTLLTDQREILLAILDRIERIEAHQADHGTMFDQVHDQLEALHTRIHNCWAKIEKGGKF